MNAYELAKAQQAYSPPTLEEIIKQQADRIAHLEMLLANRNEIIDKLDLTTPQIKELSDEEIEQIAKQHLTAHAQFIGAGEVCYEGEIEFARAIEERHGIK